MKYLLITLFTIISLNIFSQSKFTISDSIKVELSDKKINKKIQSFLKSSPDVILRNMDNGKCIGTNTLTYKCEQDVKNATATENKYYKEDASGSIYYVLSITINDGKVLFNINNVRHIGKGIILDIIYKDKYPCKFCNFDCDKSGDWCDRVSNDIKEMIRIKMKNIVANISVILKG